MILEVKCDERTNEERTNERTDRTHTRIVSFIVLDNLTLHATQVDCFQMHDVKHTLSFCLTNDCVSCISFL